MKKVNPVRQIILSATSVLIVAAACYPISEYIGYRSVALVLLLVVSVLAMRMILPAVIVAAVLGALVWDFFFIPPHFTLTIGSGEDVLLIVMYFIVAVLNGVINFRVRQLERVQRQKADSDTSLKLYNTLFNSLSHELRTPVAAILGAADTLQENEKALSATQKTALLAEITGGALRLNEQIENLLSMSRLEAGMIFPKKEWCDVAELLYGTLEKLKPEGCDHPVSIFLATDMPLVRLDYGLTGQIVHNLLNNAFRHTPAGTRVEISAKIEHDASGHFETNEHTGTPLQLVRDSLSHRLQIDISDSGPGFPEEEIERVFGKFYRPSSTVASGTGLGLFVVKGFVEAQGGDIMLSNRIQGGATFTIEFPTPILPQNLHAS
ncbi:MAG: ATP-binding protein [Saprospiraceae bacterium]